MNSWLWITNAFRQHRQHRFNDVPLQAGDALPSFFVLPHLGSGQHDNPIVDELTLSIGSGVVEDFSGQRHGLFEYCQHGIALVSLGGNSFYDFHCALKEVTEGSHEQGEQNVVANPSHELCTLS